MGVEARRKASGHNGPPRNLATPHATMDTGAPGKTGRRGTWRNPTERRQVGITAQNPPFFRVFCACAPLVSPFPPSPIPDVSVVSELWVLRNGGWWDKTRGRNWETRPKSGFVRVIPSFRCSLGFRGTPPGSAVAQCAHYTFSALLYSTRQPTPGVSKPPKRRALGQGGERGKREERKCENAKKGRI